VGLVLAAPQGFTLMEALLSLTLLSIIAVPIMMVLTSTVSSVGVREEQTVLANAARSKIEEVLAMGFANIPLSSPPGTPSALSDQLTVRSKSVQRNVIVDLADGDIPPNGVVDAGFKKITIEVSNITLHSYIAAGW
jgi:prepilin-type N-terminal cleavage/methylation domain-containing protein